MKLLSAIQAHCDFLTCQTGPTLVYYLWRISWLPHNVILVWHYTFLQRQRLYRFPSYHNLKKQYVKYWFSLIYVTRHASEISWPLTCPRGHSCTLYEWVTLNTFRISGNHHLHPPSRISLLEVLQEHTNLQWSQNVFYEESRGLGLTPSYIRAKVSKFSFMKQITLFTLSIFWHTEGDGHILWIRCINSINKLLNDWQWSITKHTIISQTVHKVNSTVMPNR
jgi:hypothetical protein